MNALNATLDESKKKTPCVKCRVRAFNFCGALKLGRAPLKQIHVSSRARQANEQSDDVHIICEGWAACSVHLGEGRRQILSFLLPGDLLSATDLFRERQDFSVQWDQSDRTIVSLGQRGAAARIARLIVSLMERLSARGLMRGQIFDFPLRQQHIADAVGLTTVHVSRVINTFREARLIETAQRQIRIISLQELQHVADAR